MLSTSSNRCPEQAKELDCFQREQCGLRRAHGWSFLFSIHALFFQQDRRPMQEDCNLLNQTFSGNTTLKLIKKHLNIKHTTRKPVVYIPSFIITRSSGYELFALQSLNSYLVLCWWNDFKKHTFLFFIWSSHTSLIQNPVRHRGAGKGESSCSDIYIAANGFNSMIVESLLLDIRASVTITPDRREKTE